MRPCNSVQPSARTGRGHFGPNSILFAVGISMRILNTLWRNLFKLEIQMSIYARTHWPFCVKLSIKLTVVRKQKQADEEAHIRSTECHPFCWNRFSRLVRKRQIWPGKQIDSSLIGRKALTSRLSAVHPMRSANKYVQMEKDNQN